MTPPNPKEAEVVAMELPPLPRPIGTIYPGNYWTASEQATPPGTAIAAVYSEDQVREAQRSAVVAALAQAAPQAAPEGFALVPLYPNAEMIRAMAEDEWAWEDLLAAAGAITEDQYSEIYGKTGAASLPDVAMLGKVVVEGSAQVARPCQDESENAPWLTLAHMICADAGIEPGHITDRLKTLRDLLEAAFRGSTITTDDADIQESREISTFRNLSEFAAEGATQAGDAHEPWIPYLSDRADGCAGRYAIARWNPSGYREVWNLRSHQWGAFSDDFLTLYEARDLLRELVIPTARIDGTTQGAQGEKA